MNHPFVFDCFKDEPIIIGLTGRTGSGCTTVSTLIRALEVNREFYTGLETAKADSAEERTFNIVHRYFRSNVNLRVHSFSVTDFINRAWLNSDSHHANLLAFIKDKFITTKEVLVASIAKEAALFSTRADDDRALNDASDKLKRILRNHTIVFQESERGNHRRQANCYTYIYQQLGNALRKTGQALLRDNDELKRGSPNEIALTTLASMVDAKISSLVGQTRTKDESTVIVIDAIRSPFEALYFRKRYANFYLITVNRPEAERIRALRSNNVKTEEIEDIDNQECPTGEFELSNCHKVNVSKCQEMADIYLANDSDERPDSTASLRRQIIRHIALMLKPGIVNPTSLEACMQVANTAKLSSGCLSRQVGAVVASKDYRILSVGWNTTPGNQIPCNLRNAYSLVNGSDRQAFSEYEHENEEFRNHMRLKLYIHRRQLDGGSSACGDPFFPYCFKDVYNGLTSDRNQVFTRSIHAEEMAFLDESVDCRGGILFATTSPCVLCAKKACHKGIERIYYLGTYPDIADEHILKGGGRELVATVFRGATGGAYSKLYTSLIPHKDEHYARSRFRFKDSLTRVKIKASDRGELGESVYLRVVEEANEDKRYLLELGLSGAASEFDFVEDGYKVAIRYKLRLPIERRKERRAAGDKCPLCGAKGLDGRCGYCGYPDGADCGVAERDAYSERQTVHVYLCADLNDKGIVRANRLSRHVWEKFRIRFVANGKFCLQLVASDKFVRVDEENGLVADVDVSVDVDETPALKSCYFELEPGQSRE